MTISEENKEIAVFQDETGAIHLKADYQEETIWATQKQMSELFHVDVRTVSEHIQNILETEELQ